jgi:hypothetical protein
VLNSRVLHYVDFHRFGDLKMRLIHNDHFCLNKQLFSNSFYVVYNRDVMCLNSNASSSQSVYNKRAILQICVIQNLKQ